MSLLRTWLKQLIREAFREEIEAQQRQTIQQMVRVMRQGEQRGYN